MKKMIRKIAAVGAGAGMLLSTLGGALAADLGSLPEPFVKNGAYVNTAFVVGAAAGTNDDAARTKLVSYFGSSVTASEDFAYNSDDDSEDKISLNGTDILTGFGEIDSGMIDTLFEGEVRVNSTDYTAREIINFSSGALVATSLTGGQEEMSAEPYMIYDAASLDYGYAFTDVVPINMVSTDKTLSIDFLGMEVDVSTISASDGVTLDVAQSVSLNTGETFEYKGHTVKLVRVYSTSAAVDVDGEEKIISEDAEKDFGDDIAVEVDVVGSADDPTQSSAVLKLSEQGVSSTVSDGDAFELFTDYKTNSQSPWVWDIETSASGLTFLGITNRWNSDDLEPSQSYKTLPITVGESVVFPNNYAAIVFDSLTTENYMGISIEFDESRDLDDADDTTTVNDKAVAIFTADSDYFELAGTDYHTIYIVNNATDYSGANSVAPTWQFWGEDDDGEHYTAGTSFTFKYNDDDDDITGDTGTTASNNQTGNIELVANDWNITIPWNFSNDNLQAEGEAETSDLLIDGTGYGAREYDILLADGTIVVNPKSNTASDKVEIKIPDQDVEATFKVYTIASSSEVEAVLKADSAASGYTNLILVGGPCVNTLTASFMGLTYPACEGASTIAQDKAVVKMVSMNGQVALVVAGWEQADTLRAANKVAVGGLSGDSLIVQ